MEGKQLAHQAPLISRLVHSFKPTSNGRQNPFFTETLYLMALTIKTILILSAHLFPLMTLSQCKAGIIQVDHYVGNEYFLAN